MFKIKNIISICLVAAVTFPMITSCNDDWKEEQYQHYIGFKAPLDTEGKSVGVTTVYVPFTRVDSENKPVFGYGKSNYMLPVMVAGSTLLDKNITVNIEHSDTLDQLNVERFGSRTTLYYKDMSAFAEYPSTININEGTEKSLLDIRFDFANIDLSDRYVLPLRVANGAGYERNPRKNYATAMLRILPYTQYSGTYQATTLKFFIVTDGMIDNEPGAMTTVQTYAVSPDEVFFYAGTFDETSELRKNFKVFAKFISTKADGSEGTVEFRCDNPAVKFQQNQPALFYTDERHDDVQNYIIRRTVVLTDVDYTFTDYLSAKGSEIVYNIRGTMTMERKLNTQMPEEDQIVFE